MSEVMPDRPKTRGVYERHKGTGVWWIRWADAQGHEHRQRIGPYQLAVEAYRKHKDEASLARKLPEISTEESKAILNSAWPPGTPSTVSFRGVYERVKGSGIYWIRYADADGREHREKVGSSQRAALAVYLQRKTGLTLPTRTLGFLATVRPKKQRKPGPKPKHYHKTESYRIGKLVEDCIPQMDRLCAALLGLSKWDRINLAKVKALVAGKDYSENDIKAAMRTPRTPIRAARLKVSLDRQYGYDTVAQYHKEFKAASSAVVTRISSLRP